MGLKNNPSFFSACKTNAKKGTRTGSFELLL